MPATPFVFRCCRTRERKPCSWPQAPYYLWRWVAWLSGVSVTRASLALVVVLVLVASFFTAVLLAALLQEVRQWVT